MWALLRRVYGRLLEVFRVSVTPLSTSWPELDNYTRKLQMIENAEENSIMLQSVSTTPIVSVSNYLASESATSDSRKGTLVQIFTDFEKACRAIPAFLQTSPKRDIYTMYAAIESIDCEPHRRH